MADPTRYETSDEQRRHRRRVPRWLWIVLILAVLVAVVVAVLASGGHDPSQFSH